MEKAVKIVEPEAPFDWSTVWTEEVIQQILDGIEELNRLVWIRDHWEERKNGQKAVA